MASKVSGLSRNGPQAPNVQTMDSVIQWITHLVLLVFILWILIYPVDNAIHPSNNWGQIDTLLVCVSVLALSTYM